MSGPTAHPTGVTLASGDPCNSLTARWGWSGSCPLEAAAPGFVLVAGRGHWRALAGEEGIGGLVGQDSWTRSGLLPRRGSSAVIDNLSDGREGGRVEAPRRNHGRCCEWGQQEAVEQLQRLLWLEPEQRPWTATGGATAL